MFGKVGNEFEEWESKDSLRLGRWIKFRGGYRLFGRRFVKMLRKFVY